MKIIVSRNNTETLFAASLQTKKGREEAGLFPAEGEKLFLEAVKPGNRERIDRVYLCESAAERYMPLISDFLGHDFAASDAAVVFSEPAFRKITCEKSPQGIITVLKTLDFSKKYNKINKKDVDELAGRKTLALAGVRDPGNLGAIVRSAVAFGFSDVVLTSDCVEITNPKTVRSAMGGIFSISFHIVEDFTSFVFAARAAGRRVLSAELREGAAPIGEIDLSSSDIVVIGNEGHGVPEEISAISNGSVFIPISDAAESLNAAVAASIILWEQSKTGC